MPEGLSAEDQAAAHRFKADNDRLERAEAEANIAARKANDKFMDMEDRDRAGENVPVDEFRVAYDDSDTASHAFFRAEDAVDANVEAATAHKDEHLGEYIQTAKAEAEAAGHTIDVEEPTGE